jgi:hypothetical protein
MRRSFIIRTPPAKIVGNKIKQNEMDGACGTYRREKKFMHGFGGKTGGKEAFQKTRPKWEDNSEVYL